MLRRAWKILLAITRREQTWRFKTRIMYLENELSSVEDRLNSKLEIEIQRRKEQKDLLHLATEELFEVEAMHTVYRRMIFARRRAGQSEARRLAALVRHQGRCIHLQGSHGFVEGLGSMYDVHLLSEYI